MPYLPQQDLIAVFNQNPQRYSLLTQLIQNIMRGESAFTTGERELIAAYVSSLNSCIFCYEAHQEIALSLNVDRQLLKAVMKNIATAPIKEQLRPVFWLIKKLTEAPSQVAQAEIDAVLAAGWDTRAVEDAIAVCSLFNLMNRLVDGFGFEYPDQEQLSTITHTINAHGYPAMIQTDT